MTTASQTGAAVNTKADIGYGFGWQVYRKPRTATDPMGAGTFGRGSSCTTNMWIDPQDGLIAVFMVQQDDYLRKDDRKMLPDFIQAAVAAFKK